MSIPNSARLVSKLGTVCLFLPTSRKEKKLLLLCLLTLDTEEIVHSGIKTEMDSCLNCAKSSTDRFLGSS